MSNNWKVYHKKIKGTKPNKLTEIFLKMNIKPANAIDIGCFFGTQDSWATIKKKKTFLTNKQVEELFKNKFEIIKKSEIERDGTTAIGNVKHWHIHNIIAKKIKN